jgi:hypothetical protein
MKPVDVEEVLTPEEFAIFKRAAECGIRIAKKLGRRDKVARMTRLLKTIEEQTCHVYLTK